VLVLGDDAPASVGGVPIGVAGERRFVSGAKSIGGYLAAVYGVGRPH
jgi:hypothetical protein